MSIISNFLLEYMVFLMKYTISVGRDPDRRSKTTWLKYCTKQRSHPKKLRMPSDGKCAENPMCKAKFTDKNTCWWESEGLERHFFKKFDTLERQSEFLKHRV